MLAYGVVKLVTTFVEPVLIPHFMEQANTTSGHAGLGGILESGA